MIVIQWQTDAGMAELADATDLGSVGQPCRFKSCCPHIPGLSGVFLCEAHMVPGFPYNSQLTEFVSLCRSAFGENLTGVYLHGSSVLGCFHPTGSDVDLLVVTEGEPAAEAKTSFMDALLPL